MPNHFHGIIAFVEGNVGADQRVCPKNKGELKPFRGKFWQRNYYEHSMRDEDDLNKMREYIQNNPLKLHLDIENPETVAEDRQEDKNL